MIACYTHRICPRSPMARAFSWPPASHAVLECSHRLRAPNVRLATACKRRSRRIVGNCSAETGDHHCFPFSHGSEPVHLRPRTVASKFASAAAVAALGLTWMWGRPESAAAGLLPRPGNRPQVETVVSVPALASVTASVSNPNDSMLLIVLVCLGFWMLSATISAAIGAVMKLSGRSLKSGTHAAGGWGSAGILDTFDIMRLPLAHEMDDQARAGTPVGGDVIYKPWDGPESSYIPINMVKVLKPGLREAGLVMHRTLLQPDEDLSIIGITKAAQNGEASGPISSNGNGTSSIKRDDHSNGSSS